MEIFGMIIGAIFFTFVITAWVVIARFLKISKKLLITGIVVILLPAMFGAFCLGHYMFIDEPLYSAAANGDVHKVQQLLRWGANPNVMFEDALPALESAAENGHTEVVRILLAHGARVDVVNDWTKQTPLMSAKKNRHWDIVRLLKKAGATR